jgi:DNA-binding GntR family transcriptional regulator
MFQRQATSDETIVGMLASTLRRDISFGVLLPDQKLKIAELRQRYGGSNHSMRESLRLLSAEGLVEATAQRGFRVVSATEDDKCDILLVRTELEKIALALAIEQGDVAWEGRFIAAHHSLQVIETKLKENPDDPVVVEWDEACRAFSVAIIDACNSPRIVDLQRKFFNQSRRFRLALYREGLLNFERRKTRQQSLLDALLRRDSEAAADLLVVDIKAELYAENE